MGIDEPIAHVAGQIDVGHGFERREVASVFHGGAGGENEQGDEERQVFHVQ